MNEHFSREDFHFYQPGTWKLIMRKHCKLNMWFNGFGSHIYRVKLGWNSTTKGPEYNTISYLQEKKIYIYISWHGDSPLSFRFTVVLRRILKYIFSSVLSCPQQDMWFGRSSPLFLEADDQRTMKLLQVIIQRWFLFIVIKRLFETPAIIKVTKETICKNIRSILWMRPKS